MQPSPVRDKPGPQRIEIISGSGRSKIWSAEITPAEPGAVRQVLVSVALTQRGQRQSATSDDDGQEAPREPRRTEQSTRPGLHTSRGLLPEIDH